MWPSSSLLGKNGAWLCHSCRELPVPSKATTGYGFGHPYLSCRVLTNLWLSVGGERGHECVSGHIPSQPSSCNRQEKQQRSSHFPLSWAALVYPFPALSALIDLATCLVQPFLYPSLATHITNSSPVTQP